MIYQIRHRTHLEDIIYAVNLYFDGLSLRKTSKALSQFVKRSHTAIRDWIQKYQPQRLSSKTKKINEYIVDETLIKVGFPRHLAMDCNRARKQAKSRTS